MRYVVEGVFEEIDWKCIEERVKGNEKHACCYSWSWWVFSFAWESENCLREIESNKTESVCRKSGYKKSILLTVPLKFVIKIKYPKYPSLIASFLEP